MTELSVLHISTADNLGGSAKSAYKIHRGIQQLGFRSQMLVRNKVTQDPSVRSMQNFGSLWRNLDRIGRHLFDRVGLQYLLYPSYLTLTKTPWFREIDIIQLYNIHGGYFSPLALAALSKNRPVVWRLSDMWPFTGHCAYSHGCERWKSGCGKCPRLSEYPALSIDTSRLLWRIKKNIYQRTQLTMVATNSWMAKAVKASPLLQRFPLEIIANGIDIELYRPINKRNAREILGIAPEAKVVLFSAHVAAPNTRKGGEYLAPVMEKLCSSGVKNLTLVIQGEHAENWQIQCNCPLVRIGFIQNERFMPLVYSAADILVYPALAENFPNTILEAMGCGTPVVAFNSGGVSDIIRHMGNGYLASAGNADELARGLRILLTSSLPAMAKRCRDIIEREYSMQTQAQRFADLYRQLCEKFEKY